MPRTTVSSITSQATSASMPRPGCAPTPSAGAAKLAASKAEGVALINIFDPTVSMFRLSCVLFGLGVLLTTSVAAATTDEFVDPQQDSAALILTGSVFHADGRSALGTVVVSSAGGLTEVEADGAFRLVVQLTRDIESLEVTAVASGVQGAFTATRHVAGFGFGGSKEVGALQLIQGQGCQPSWVPTFGGEQGTDKTVSAMTVFDDGTGPALYVGGSFTIAGGLAGAKHIAKWDGSRWSTLGSGLGLQTNQFVTALTVFDDGTGAALYVGGKFGSAGSISAKRIAKWDGQSWSALGAGMNDTVRSLTAFDDGTGPALYAAGNFTIAGGVVVNCIAKWDGQSWSALGSGMNNTVFALCVFDDGTGPALHAGGRFNLAGGVAVKSIATWDGQSWSALGSGLGNGGSDVVYALRSFDDGTGAALYAGGVFGIAGGVTAENVAKWDGRTWSALGLGLGNHLDSGSSASVRALCVFDDGAGPALYAAGNFSSAGGVPAKSTAKWDGQSWSALGSGVNGTVFALSAFDHGTGSALYAGGTITLAGGEAANRIANWDGASWSVLGSGINKDTTTFSVTTVNALAAFDDGTGTALYAGGQFLSAGGVAVNYIVKWDGAAWSALGSGMDNTVYALNVFDDGQGLALYAGGQFTIAGGVAVNSIAKWDGANWSALDSGVNGTVYVLTVFDDGAGASLHVGGGFTTAGGVAAAYIAEWDGQSWSALGSGMNFVVRTLTVLDFGVRPALYAGGHFTFAGGVLVNRVAKWDGVTWSALGSGVNSTIRALTAFDDGTGPALYVGGSFSTAGGVTANRIAKWDDHSWSALGSGMDGVAPGNLSSEVLALAVFDDGTGPALHAGGSFANAGGVAASGLAKWDGVTWSALDSNWNSAVDTLAVFDDGAGSALNVGGPFIASPAGDSYVARWMGCPLALPPLTADTNTLSVSSGGVQSLSLQAGQAHAGRTYLLLGSITGTSPGVDIGLVHVPLNVDQYLILLAATPGAGPLSPNPGLLDNLGRAAVQVVLPGNLLSPALVGLEVNHAYVLLGPIDFVSNPVGVVLVP